MKNKKTHISVILDRTGSMESIRDDVIGGFNAFLKEQKEGKDKTTLTLVQFDTQNPYEIIHWLKPISEVTELNKSTYVPRAATPLLDALGRGINDLEKCIDDLKKSDKPGKVVVVVITDGQENSSVEFKKDQIVKMIKERQEKDNWQFVFLSADLEAIKDAGAMGIRARASMSFDKDNKGVSDAFASLSKRIMDYRTEISNSVEFEEEDRNKQKSEKRRN